MKRLFSRLFLAQARNAWFYLAIAGLAFTVYPSQVLSQEAYSESLSRLDEIYINVDRLELDDHPRKTKANLLDLRLEENQVKTRLKIESKNRPEFFLSRLANDSFHPMTLYSLAIIFLRQFSVEAHLPELNQLIYGITKMLEGHHYTPAQIHLILHYYRSIASQYEISLTMSEPFMEMVSCQLYEMSEEYCQKKDSSEASDSFDNNEKVKQFESALKLLKEIQALNLKKQWHHLKITLDEVWQKFDENDDGLTYFSEIISSFSGISVSEGKRLINKNRWFIQHHFGLTVNLDFDLRTLWSAASQGRSILGAMDYNEDGSVSQSEYIQFFKDSLFYRDEDQSLVWIDFSYVDDDGNGKVSEREIRSKVRNWHRLPDFIQEQILIRFLGKRAG